MTTTPRPARTPNVREQMPLDSRLRARPLQEVQSSSGTMLGREAQGYSRYGEEADAEALSRLRSPFAESLLSDVAAQDGAFWLVPARDGDSEPELLVETQDGAWLSVDAVTVAGVGVMGLRVIPAGSEPTVEDGAVQVDATGARTALYALARQVGAEMVDVDDFGPPAPVEPVRDDDELRAEVGEQFDAVLAPQLAPAWSEQVGSPPRPAARAAYERARMSDFAVIRRAQYDELRSVASGFAALTASATSQQAGELAGRVSRATAALPAEARALLAAAGSQAGDYASGSTAVRTASNAAAQARLALALHATCLAVLKESGVTFLAGASS